MNRATVVTAPRGYARALACALCQQRNSSAIEISLVQHASKQALELPASRAYLRRFVSADAQPKTFVGVSPDARSCFCSMLRWDQVPEPQLQEGRPEVPGNGSPQTFHLRPAYVVVKDENSTRLMDSHLWATLYEEVGFHFP